MKSWNGLRLIMWCFLHHYARPSSWSGLSAALKSFWSEYRFSTYCTCKVLLLYAEFWQEVLSYFSTCKISKRASSKVSLVCPSGRALYALRIKKKSFWLKCGPSDLRDCLYWRIKTYIKSGSIKKKSSLLCASGKSFCVDPSEIFFKDFNIEMQKKKT